MKLIYMVRNAIKQSASQAVFKNMLVLASGGGAAKIISISATPLLTRLYTPSDFGALSILVAITSILAPVVTLRYVVAIPLHPNDRVALNLVALCAFLTLLLSTMITLLFWVGWYADVGFPEEMAPYWWTIPIALIAVSLHETLAYWGIRKKRFFPIAKSEFYQALIGTIVKLSLAFSGKGAFGLLVGQVVQQGGGSVILAAQFIEDLKKGARCIGARNLKLVLNRYIRFPKNRLPAQLSQNLSAHIPVILVSVYYGAEEAGQLGLALFVLAFPIMLVSQTAAKAHYSELASLQDDQAAAFEITKSVVYRLLLLAVVPVVVLLLFGESLFSLVFGEEWSEAGRFATSLSLYLLALFCFPPMINVLTYLGREFAGLCINFIRLACVLLVFYVSSLLEVSVIEAVRAYSILLLIHFSLSIAAIFYIFYKSTKSQAR